MAAELVAPAAAGGPNQDILLTCVLQQLLSTIPRRKVCGNGGTPLPPPGYPKHSISLTKAEIYPNEACWGKDIFATAAVCPAVLSAKAEKSRNMTLLSGFVCA